MLSQNIKWMETALKLIRIKKSQSWNDKSASWIDKLQWFSLICFLMLVQIIARPEPTLKTIAIKPSRSQNKPTGILTSLSLLIWLNKLQRFCTAYFLRLSQIIARPEHTLKSIAMKPSRSRDDSKGILTSLQLKIWLNKLHRFCTAYFLRLSQIIRRPEPTLQSIAIKPSRSWNKSTGILTSLSLMIWLNKLHRFCTAYFLSLSQIIEMPEPIQKSIAIKPNRSWNKTSGIFNSLSKHNMG
jgi:hypothetical protein